jgi:enoyl-CoA hydratase/carnithine racemase
VVEDAEVFDAAQEWATTIAGYSPWAVSKTKQLAYEGLHLPFDEAFSREASVTAESYLRPEVATAYTAFTARKGSKP